VVNVAGSDADSPDATSSSDDVVPSLGLPKGGGAIRGIGETFTTNPVTGSANLRVPLPISPARGAASVPELELQYDSSNGNGAFGLGWRLTLPSITRRTDRGLPQYQDAAESDIYIFSGGEDLVPAEDVPPRDGYSIRRYRPRIERAFWRIERWTRDDGDIHWRTITRENVTGYFGLTSASRVSDPADASHIFTWLLDETRDDRGNLVSYEYVPEDSRNVDVSSACERQRSDTSRAAERYLKRVKYGNTSAQASSDDPQQSWLFEVVFDYDEGHCQAQPLDAQGRQFVSASLAPTQPWTARLDPFSSYRAGFEQRFYRLCRRVLMFHHFAEELQTPDYLVRALSLTYQQSAVASQIVAITQSGFSRQSDGTYLEVALPPVELTYTEAVVQNSVAELDAASLANLPPESGVRFQWLDLDGDGVPSVLAESDDAWFYKRNLSPLTFALDSPQPPSAQLEALSDVTRVPGLAGASARHRFVDLAGDGRLDCLTLNATTGGFYKRSDRGWEAYRPLASLPRLDWNDPNLRWLDLDGDGFADLLLTDHDVFTWYASQAEAGFGAPQRVPHARSEDDGPAILFSDVTQSIFLADMTGDGLSDIVRIRNAEICYWPNIGYGQFGQRIVMDGAPWLDGPDLFDARRVRLGDIDGSGTTDLVYLGSDGVSLWLNQAGNSWSAPQPVIDFPAVDDLSSVQLLDLLGNGTACLVWMSSLPGDSRRTIRYVDLMGGMKPHLLAGTRNNLGAETIIQYVPSTTFCLADGRAGRPWVTRLPFPVPVVARVERLDYVSRNRFITRYDYHHGYFDAVEREFRGFGMVEQRDTEELGVLSASGALPDATNADAASYVPPVLTKSWFHTGAYPIGPTVSRLYAGEYYREPGLDTQQLQALMLPDSVLPSSLTGDELHEALRALKGKPLRHEVYALDGSTVAAQPYLVSENNYSVELLQPLGQNRHAVFFTHARESISLHYDRALYTVGNAQLADPRVSHSFTFAVDDYGNVLQTAAVAYGRRHDDPDARLMASDRDVQRQLHVTLRERAYTNAILEDDDYRAPMPSEQRTWELIRVNPDSTIPLVTNFFDFDELQSKITAASDGAHDLPYEDIDAAGATQAQPYRRPLSLSRVLYRKDDLTVALPLGTLESLALPYDRYRLTLTPGLLNVYRRGQTPLLATPIPTLRDQGSYVLGDDQQSLGLFPNSDASGNWWVSSGQVFYSPDPNATAAQELSLAQAHFFLGRRYRDGFGNNSIVTFDAHDLLPLNITNALGSHVTTGDRDASGTITNGNDYRVLQPARLTDANGNRSAVAYDTLGLVAATAVMGKSSETLGDALSGFTIDLTQADRDSFFSDPQGQAALLLGQATTRAIYDVGRFARDPNAAAPIYAAVIARETHVSDLAAGATSEVLISFTYSDGFARTIQNKGQCAPGPLTPGGVTVDPRWITSGWTVFDNKGQAVRQYEPFFDSSHDFSFGVAVGVSPTFFYDPVGRAAATLHPDHAWEKVLVDPWRQESWDVNDTVLLDPAGDPDVSRYFLRLPTADYEPTWYASRINGADPEAKDAAQKTAQHAGTPKLSQLDSLGRAFLTLAHNRVQSGGITVEAYYRTLVTLDVQGFRRSLTDALERQVMRSDFNMLGGNLHDLHVDAGERWLLADAGGQALLAWNDTQQMRHEYDQLRRQIHLFVTDAGVAERLAEQNVYGEGQANDVQLNLRGRRFQQLDNSGVQSSQRFDFKGNLLASTQQLRQGYSDRVDWSQPVPLASEIFSSSSTFDALNRTVTDIAPDGSIVRPGYDEASFLVTLAVNLRGSATSTPYVSGITYNAKGQRQTIAYGNGSSSSYEYDPSTFRIVHLQTTRSGGSVLQDLRYAYDPSGHITHITDGAQQTIYFNNQVADPSGDYTYDAIYRLILATGRELLGLAAQPQTTWDDSARMGQALPADASALRPYSEQYGYDAVGNLSSLAHTALNGNWTRDYVYDQPNSPPTNNRLTSTSVGQINEQYAYDARGNTTSMPHLSTMTWTFKDELESTQQQSGPGERTWFVYDATGRRVRKVTSSASGATAKERIYLDGYEVYREYDASAAITLERQSLHVMDDASRVALVETTTIDSSVSAATLPSTAIRYQLGNHLGSSCIELDENAAVITYEEYYPYGSTSFQSGRSLAEVSLKRYRYSGKERDSETGFSYHGARYYAPWLGRWTSCDPVSTGAMSRYCGMGSNPIMRIDTDGRQDTAYTRYLDRKFETAQGATEVYEAQKGLATAVGNAIQYLRKKGGEWLFDADAQKAYNDTINSNLPRVPENPWLMVTGQIMGETPDVSSGLWMMMFGAWDSAPAPVVDPVALPPAPKLSSAQLLRSEAQALRSEAHVLRENWHKAVDAKDVHAPELQAQALSKEHAATAMENKATAAETKPSVIPDHPMIDGASVKPLPKSASSTKALNDLANNYYRWGLPDTAGARIGLAFYDAEGNVFLRVLDKDLSVISESKIGKVSTEGLPGKFGDASFGSAIEARVNELIGQQTGNAAVPKHGNANGVDYSPVLPPEVLRAPPANDVTPH
jgi:RHS repeat-associated protein